MARERGRRYLPAGALVILLAISAALRFPGLYASPHWAGDEGYNLNIAQNLLQGRLQMFALSYAYVQHPPLFFVLLGVAVKLFGFSITTLRTLTALLGVLTTGFVYAAGRQICGERGGVLAALIFAIWPLAVTGNRWGDTYNLLMLVGVATLWTALQAFERRPPGLPERLHASAQPTLLAASPRPWLLLAALFAGLGVVSDVEGIYLIAWIVPVAFLIDRRPATLGPVVLVALLPGLIFLAWVTMVAPASYWFDLTHNVDRINKGAAQLVTWLVHYQSFLVVDYWLVLGLIGLLLVRRQRGPVFGLALLMLLVILQVRDPNPYFRTAVPLLPIVALGLGMLLERGLPFLYGWLQTIWHNSSLACTPGLAGLRPFWTTIPLVLFVGGPLMIAAGTSIIGAAGMFPTRIEEGLATHPAQAEQVAVYLNTHASSDDVILLSPQIAWLVEGRTAEILQSAAARGNHAGFYPADIPADRWVYDPYYLGGQVRYIVMDDFWRTWMKASSSDTSESHVEVEQLADVEASWLPVYQVGEYTIYRRP